jgi:hypothetical protein
LISKILEKNGRHRVELVENGREVLASRFKQRKFDMIFWRTIMQSKNGTRLNSSGIRSGITIMVITWCCL